MGRTALLLVLGMSVIFVSIAPNIYHTSTFAYQNYLNYYSTESVHDLAESAANMTANQVFINSNYIGGFATKSLGNGTYKSSVKKYPADTTKIEVDAYATVSGISDTITILLQPSSFSKFAYYSIVEGTIYWITGDTVWGPLHTEDVLHVSGNPTFEGKVTTKSGISKLNGSADHPQFLGGYQSGVSLTLPTDFSKLKNYAQNGGKYFSGGSDIYMAFNSNGTVTYRTGSWTAAATTVAINTLAPDGVLMVDGGNLHLKGKLNGQMTVVSTGTGKNVYIDSSVTYNSNPQTNSNSTDMLGICCDNDVIITDNTNNHNCEVDASIMSRTGGLSAQDYDTRAIGTLTLLGGLQQYQRGAVGTFSGSTIVSGFHKNYRYDNRLMVSYPPDYPNTGSFEVLSWKE